MKRKISLSLSLKILLWILPPMIIATTVSVVLSNRFLEQELVTQAENSARTYSDIIKESMVSMMSTNYKVDERFLQNLHRVEGIDSLRIVLGDLRLREEFLTEEREIRLEIRRNINGRPDSIDELVMKSGKASLVKDGDRVRVTVPFKADATCQKCHTVPEGFPLGAADIHMTLARLSESLEGSWKRSATLFILFFAASLAVGVLAFRRVVTEPVEALVFAARRIGQGKFDRAVRMPETRDELWVLAGAFEEMRTSLKETVDELARLNRELAQKNRSLFESFQALQKAQDELIQSERLSAVGKMASSIIHDFKNPMTVILSFAERLKLSTGMSDEMRNKAFTMIDRSIRQMEQMTRDLLDFSRGHVRLNVENVPASAIINDVKENVQESLQQENVALNIDQQYHGNIPVDVNHFRRAMINIITNAQEAMPQGGTLTIGVHRQNGYAEIDITDTGVGIPDRLKDSVFEAFVSHGKPGGTGLGLAITKLVVNQHGGRIGVQSKIGEGTTFSILLPLTLAQRQ